MKVECVKIIDTKPEKQIEKSSWLTVGKIYQVLSVFVADGKPGEYRLIADDGYTPGMYQASQFKVVSNTLPPNWIANYGAKAYFELAPSDWIKPGFWENYFDGDPTAIKQFEDEKGKIIQLD